MLAILYAVLGAQCTFILTRRLRVLIPIVYLHLCRARIVQLQDVPWDFMNAT